MKHEKKLEFMWKRYGKYVLCLGAGVLFYLAAEFVDAQTATVENGTIFRNDCGQGDAEYSFFVDGLDEASGGEPVHVLVPERELTAEEFEQLLPKMTEQLCLEILGENESLAEVRSDLALVKELSEYGVSVRWESGNPEVVSELGLVSVPAGSDSKGIRVFLTAILSAGSSKESVELPVTVYPPERTRRDRFEEYLQSVIAQRPEEEAVVLPTEFEGTALTYRETERSQNPVLLLLGVVAAACLYYKERSDRREADRRREDSLAADYPDLVSGFLILTGAGYPGKAAWKKLLSDYLESDQPGEHPLYEEMQIAVNQMETGTPETRAYADFGRRCGLRCYIRFASLLESSVSTGSRNFRALLEAEADDAFRQRAAMARRKGEEASSRLLIPMFGMLAVVMVMAAAPAFLSMGS